MAEIFRESTEGLIRFHPKIADEGLPYFCGRRGGHNRRGHCQKCCENATRDNNMTPRALNA
jgi:hypothetical protein